MVVWVKSLGGTTIVRPSSSHLAALDFTDEAKSLNPSAVTLVLIAYNRCSIMIVGESLKQYAVV